jgi:hypothetical protein
MLNYFFKNIMKNQNGNNIFFLNEKRYILLPELIGIQFQFKKIFVIGDNLEINQFNNILNPAKYDYTGKISSCNNVAEFDAKYKMDYNYFCLMLCLRQEADYIIFNNISNISTELKYRIKNYIIGFNENIVFYNCSSSIINLVEQPEINIYDLTKYSIENKLNRF